MPGYRALDFQYRKHANSLNRKEYIKEASLFATVSSIRQGFSDDVGNSRRQLSFNAIFSRQTMTSTLLTRAYKQCRA